MKSLLVLLLLCSQSAIASQNCADLFSSEVYYTSNRIQIFDLSSIYKNNRERFDIKKEILNFSVPKFNGQELKKIENRGAVNVGIYSFDDPKHGPSILKLYKFPEQKLKEFKSLEEEHLNTPKEIIDVVSIVRGNLLSQDFGGPKLYDSGFLKAEDGSFYFFIHMEKIFPDVEFFSVKEIAWTHKRNKELVKILRKYPKILNDLDMLSQDLIKQQIVPIDPDIAIAKDGRIRWIDTDYWEIGTAEQTRLTMSHLVDLLNEMKRGSIFSLY